jgi:hypothetical protein
MGSQSIRICKNCGPHDEWRIKGRTGYRCVPCARRADIRSYIKHKSKRISKVIRWKKDNPDKSSKIAKKWRESHTKLRRDYSQKWTHDTRLTVLQAYSCDKSECRCCENSDVSVLTIDHIKGGGTKHRQNVGSGTAFYRWLINNKFPSGYQILCWNCNIAKGLYGTCPHILPRDISTVRKNRLTALRHYGGEILQCISCHENHWQFLALDHLNNDGAKQRKSLGTGNKYYYWIIKNNFPPIFQVLCHNCNSIKVIQ